jgi:hypothetical protein
MLANTDIFDEYLKDLVWIYERESGYVASQSKDIQNPFPLHIGPKWVNFQKKYEYNPPHVHHGVLSYVIWHNDESEAELGPWKSKLENPLYFSYNGAFTFAFPDPRQNSVWVKNIIFKLSQNMNHHICIFPANLSHQVFPFYSSDEYRISISGNLHFHKDSEFTVVEK